MKQTTRLLLVALVAGVLPSAGVNAQQRGSDICPVNRQFGNSPPAVVFVKKTQPTIALAGHHTRNEEGHCCLATIKPCLRVDPHGGIRVLFVEQSRTH